MVLQEQSLYYLQTLFIQEPQWGQVELHCGETKSEKLFPASSHFPPFFSVPTTEVQRKDLVLFLHLENIYVWDMGLSFLSTRRV